MEGATPQAFVWNWNPDVTSLCETVNAVKFDIVAKICFDGHLVKHNADVG